jgi:hypothetical protein
MPSLQGKSKKIKETRIITRRTTFSDDSGVVNIYKTLSLFKDEAPHPSKTMMNLTTPITSMKFNHDGQILGIASRSKKNAFRLVS